MAILNIENVNTGQVNYVPSIVFIDTNDTVATVTTAGYLNNLVTNQGRILNNTMMACVTTKESATADPVTNWFQVTLSGSNWSLTALPETLGITTASTSTSSATPGTIRALIGSVTETATTMTSGNLVGVRGVVNYVGASGGFLYGVQGKLINTGTLSGSSWSAPIFGQFDISAATVNAGQTAAIWGDYGTSSGTISDASGMRGVAMTNTTSAVLNAQDYRYGNATYLLELAGAGGTLNYYANAGTSAGSAGDAAHCAAQKVIKIEINGSACYIPVFTQNT